MPDTEILTMTAALIRERIGSISDLPDEMGNTIANVYYRLCMELQRSSPEQVSPSPTKASDLLDTLTSNARQTAHLIAAARAVPEMVSGFREIDPFRQPNARKAALDLFLDLFKYNIPNAHKMVGLRRMIGRSCRKPNEIPGLNALISAQMTQSTPSLFQHQYHHQEFETIPLDNSEFHAHSASQQMAATKLQLFAFMARTKTGQRITGRACAENKAKAVNQIERAGYIPVNVSTVHGAFGEEIGVSLVEIQDDIPKKANDAQPSKQIDTTKTLSRRKSWATILDLYIAFVSASATSVFLSVFGTRTSVFSTDTGISFLYPMIAFLAPDLFFLTSKSATPGMYALGLRYKLINSNIWRFKDIISVTLPGRFILFRFHQYNERFVLTAHHKVGAWRIASIVTLAYAVLHFQNAVTQLYRGEIQDTPDIHTLVFGSIGIVVLLAIPFGLYLIFNMLTALSLFAARSPNSIMRRLCVLIKVFKWLAYALAFALLLGTTSRIPAEIFNIVIAFYAKSRGVY